MRRRGNMTRESNHRGFAGTRACPLNVLPDRKAGDAERLRTDANRSVKRGVATRLSMVWPGQDRPAYIRSVHRGRRVTKTFAWDTKYGPTAGSWPSGSISGR
jgi:hypothetical protein